KKQLDELAVAKGHYFLPLPPYSPELNPIERFWAGLKRKVVECLRIVQSVEYCLECYFKAK
ncbi:transposase, partial [Streptococcus suis]|uniref:transposase n=1 Tax=Streptococcus suis TaxID=1307 RepID=UPI0038B9F116